MMDIPIFITRGRQSTTILYRFMMTKWKIRLMMMIICWNMLKWNVSVRLCLLNEDKDALVVVAVVVKMIMLDVVADKLTRPRRSSSPQFIGEWFVIHFVYINCLPQSLVIHSRMRIFGTILYIWWIRCINEYIYVEARLDINLVMLSLAHRSLLSFGIASGIWRQTDRTRKDLLYSIQLIENVRVAFGLA